MGHTRAGRVLRNAWGSLAVVAILAFISYGLPLIDRSLPAVRPVVAGEPYAVGGTVTMVPPTGASVDVTRTRPGDQRGSALFQAHGLRLAIMVRPHLGSLADAADQLRSKITNMAGYQVTGKERSTSTRDGVAGLRGWFSSPGRIGEYMVFVADEQAVELTIGGSGEQLRRQAVAIDATVRSIAFRES